MIAIDHALLVTYFLSAPRINADEGQRPHEKISYTRKKNICIPHDIGQDVVKALRSRHEDSRSIRALVKSHERVPPVITKRQALYSALRPPGSATLATFGPSTARA